MGITRWGTWQVVGAVCGAHLAAATLVIVGANTDGSWPTYAGVVVNSVAWVLLCAWLVLRDRQAAKMQRQRDEALGHTMTTVCKALGVKEPHAKVYHLDLVRQKSAG